MWLHWSCSSEAKIFRSGKWVTKGHSREYYVRNGEESVKVCKVTFRSIFAVSGGRINQALKAQSAALGAPHTDRRGRHEPINKVTEEQKVFGRQHIESFPKYRSHYSWKDNPNRSYLAPILSLAKMFELYKVKCTEADSVPWVYRKIFNTECSLPFGRYGRRTCTYTMPNVLTYSVHYGCSLLLSLSLSLSRSL